MSVTLTNNGQVVDALPELGQRVALDETTKAALIGYIQKNENDPAYKAFVSGADAARLDAMMEAPDAEMSAAERRLSRARTGTIEQEEKPFEPVELDGETIYIKRLILSDCYALHLTGSRDGDGRLNIEESGDDLRSFLIPVLISCVFEDAKGLKPYFTWKTATAYADSTKAEIIKWTRDVFNTALYFNEPLVPKETKAHEIPGREPISQTSGTAPSLTEETSLNLTPTSGTSGSVVTDGTDKPSISAED